MKIICIGMNYKKHIAEMGKTYPDVPVFFLKPETALLLKNRPFFLPDFSQDVQYELEVVIRINKLGKTIARRFAHTYYDEVGLGIDFTARDLQKECIEKGRPWEIAKSFDYSAPVGRFLPKAQFSDINSLNFYLLKNGQRVQSGCTCDMIFSIDELVSYVSNFYTLKIGDIIFTGTPAGVGSVDINDHLEAYLEGEKLLDFNVK